MHLHAFAGGADARVVVLGLAHDAVDGFIAVVGIVVEKHQFFGAALHRDVDAFAPRAVSPALFELLVLVGQVLRVVDEHVGALCQFAHVLVEHGMAGLVIGGVDQDAVLGLQAETEAALRMVQPHGLHGAIVEGDAVFFDVVEVAVRGHLRHVDGKIRIGHLLFDGALQPARAVRRMEEEIRSLKVYPAMLNFSKSTHIVEH